MLHRSDPAANRLQTLFVNTNIDSRHVRQWERERERERKREKERERERKRE